jgi:hypothetical protein
MWRPETGGCGPDQGFNTLQKIGFAALGTKYGRPKLLVVRNQTMTQHICVKTFRGDRRSFIEFQSYLTRIDRYTLSLCVPATDLEDFRSLAAPGSWLTSNEDLLARFGVHHPLRESWYSQQLFKLLLVAVSPAEINWVLDANTLLLEPLPEFSPIDPIPLALDDLLPEDLKWFAASAQFLGLPPPDTPIAPVNQPLRRSVVQQMLSFIAWRSGKNPVAELADCIVAGQRAGSPIWTEFGLYHCFATYLAPAAHRLGENRRIYYYRHHREGPKFPKWLLEIKRTRPPMLKVYARRPDIYQLTNRQLDAVYERIRVAVGEPS